MHRSSRFVATLLLAPLLAQSLLASPVLLPLPQIAVAASSQAALATTGKALPSASERLGGKKAAMQMPDFAAPASQDQTGELQKDGSFSLPRNYVANPDYPAASPPSNAPVNGKLGGPSPMSLSVSGDVTSNTTWTLGNSPYIASGSINVQ